KIPKASEKNFIAGDHPYESSKAAADLIATTYAKTYKMPVVVSRFGNVYGEGDLNFSRIVPGIMRSAILGETLGVRSNGKFVRDYVYVGDVVDAMTALITNIKKVRGQAFNISSLENLSVVELIRKMESLLSLKIEYKILSIAINEIPTQSVNFGKIRKTLGWKPKNNFKKTISGMYAWYKSYFEGVK
ncbi:MAG: GDP-mannose 4,6-dehydratase, partial [Candidatus Curtissbacteria bacterium]|nr:GDP-mannose 4,6-dehydratase [Candidatus Curtissbacteria bacterium]